jgi:serine/threonine-protein kinase
MTQRQTDAEASRDASGRLPVGYRIRGRYVIRRFVSLGAATRVYAAEDVQTGRLVAVKVVRIDVNVKGVVDRFQHEVLVCRLFDSPHLPRVFDQGRLDNGSLFMVMELLTGQTLDQRLGHGPLAVPAVIELGRQIATALSGAHARGIVHCDVKPHNVILQPDEERGFMVKLIDFGIATRDTARVDTGTRRETVLGTPAYMSPEQIRGMRLDIRTDIYSAGVVLYQALTDRLPFDGSSSRAIMEAALRDPIIPPRVLRPSCPDVLERALMRALCRDRNYRHATAGELCRELEDVVQREHYAAGAAAWRQRSELQARPLHTPYDPTQPVRRVDVTPAAGQLNDTQPVAPPEDAETERVDLMLNA